METARGWATETRGASQEHKSRNGNELEDRDWVWGGGKGGGLGNGEGTLSQDGVEGGKGCKERGCDLEQCQDCAEAIMNAGNRRRWEWPRGKWPLDLG